MGLGAKYGKIPKIPGRSRTLLFIGARLLIGWSGGRHASQIRSSQGRWLAHGSHMVCACEGSLAVCDWSEACVRCAGDQHVRGSRWHSLIVPRSRLTRARLGARCEARTRLHTRRSSDVPRLRMTQHLGDSAGHVSHSKRG